MRSTLTSLTRITKLDIKNHSLHVLRAPGVWYENAVEFRVQGNLYAATTRESIGPAKKVCHVTLTPHAGTLVEAIESPPPRKHYYDEDGDPQYHMPQDLAEKWAHEVRYVTPETAARAPKAVLKVYMAGLAPLTDPAIVVGANAILQDFVSRGFFPQEFPLIFQELP